MIHNDTNLGTTPQNFPAEINIEVLTSQMGKPNTYQKYVVGMRVRYTQKSIANDKAPVQIVNVVYKELLPKDVENQRSKSWRQPFYDLFYPLVQKDSFGDHYSAWGAISMFATISLLILS